MSGPRGAYFQTHLHIHGQAVLLLAASHRGQNWAGVQGQVHSGDNRHLSLVHGLS